MQNPIKMIAVILTVYQRTRLSMDDVRKAFDLFQAQRDQSRPLIIAGFSQGGLAVVELLKHIDDETYSQLAAAYVLGYKVTKANMAACSHIRRAGVSCVRGHQLQCVGISSVPRLPQRG